MKNLLKRSEKFKNNLHFVKSTAELDEDNVDSVLFFCSLKFSLKKLKKA